MPTYAFVPLFCFFCHKKVQLERAPSQTAIPHTICNFLLHIPAAPRPSPGAPSLQLAACVAYFTKLQPAVEQALPELAVFRELHEDEHDGDEEGDDDDEDDHHDDDDNGLSQSSSLMVSLLLSPSPFVPKAHDCFTVLAVDDDPRCARQAQLATTSKVNSWKSAAF